VTDYELAVKRLRGPRSFAVTLKLAGGAIAGKAAAAALAITIAPTAQASNADATSEVDYGDPDYEYAPLESYSPFVVVSSAADHSRVPLSDFMLPDEFWSGRK
jgi:hypothetical protein